MNIIIQPQAQSRFQILINGEKWKEIHQSIFGKKPTIPSAETLDQLEHLFDELEYRRVKSYLLWRLSAKSYHSDMIFKMLEERLVAHATAERVIEEFKKLGYFDDQAWIDNFVRSQSKRYSNRLILQKLRQKGIPQECLQEIPIIADERAAIKHLLNTRYSKKNFQDQKERQKVISALMRKGYKYEDIAFIIGDLIGNK
jgi:regulatory protein